MILGTGFDLIDVARFEREENRRGGALFEELFTPAERERCRRLRRPAAGYAAAFAAKEACYKALGTGKIGRMRWQDLEVDWPDAACPTLRLAGEALAEAGRLGATEAHLAIGLTRNTAFAVVVLCRGTGSQGAGGLGVRDWGFGTSGR